MKRPMLKTHRGGKPKKLPSEGPHPKRDVPQPAFSLGLVGPEEGSPFVVIDSLGGDPHYKPEGLPDPSIEAKLHTFLDTGIMGAMVPHRPCPECDRAKKPT